MTMFARWKQGLGIGARLVCFGAFLWIVTIPARALEMLPEEYSTLRGCLVLAYLLTVVPLLLPVLLKTCGLGAQSSGEFDMRGGMNEASRRKTEELKREAAARRELGS